MTDLQQSSDGILEKVGAFILRQTEDGYEMLFFRELSARKPDHPVLVPGGGIEPGETEEEALHREIHEESGLLNLPIVRKLGISERCRLKSRKQVRRHFYVLTAPADTPDHWVHVVHGDGEDAGDHFSYFWQRSPKHLPVPDSYSLFLNPLYLPEVFPTHEPWQGWFS